MQLLLSFQLGCHPYLVLMNSVSTTDHQPCLLHSHSGQLPYPGPPSFLQDCSIPQMLEFLAHFFPIPSCLIITMIFPEQRSDSVSHLISSPAPAVLCMPPSLSLLPSMDFLAFSALSTRTAYEILFFFFFLKFLAALDLVLSSPLDMLPFLDFRITTLSWFLFSLPAHCSDR